MKRLFLLLFLLLVSCQEPAAQSLPTLAPNGPSAPPPTPPITPAAAVAEPTVAPAAEPTPIATLAPAATATPAPWRVSASAAVPPELVAVAQELAAAAPDVLVWVDQGEESDVQLQVDRGEPLATWVYAVVVPFATIQDDTSLDALRAAWSGASAPSPLLTEQTAALLSQLWGAGTAETVPVEQLADQLWQARTRWSLLPFQQLQPSLKVWSLAGTSPLDEGFDARAYPLTVQVGVSGNEAAVDALQQRWPTERTSNYQPEQLTRVAMTGVTALVRATAYQMEIRSLLYPGEEVAPVLQGADIAHVSNEVSFVYDCPYPSYIGDPVFCSDPRYLELLEWLDVDVVELTGNHLNDWGWQYLPYTLDLYDEKGMGYFGGGRNLEDAAEPLLLEHNGNRIAFVGCNPVGPAGGWATPDRAGALPCDYAALKEQIASLRESGYLVIATQQYQEIYNYAPSASQRSDFEALAAAGAAAVSGSQGHHAQGFGFYQGAFIHYGLGNLFFDQMDQLGTRQTFVDTYTIYQGRLLNVALWTGLIENYARPRLMTAEERAQLLQTVFQASGW